MKHSFYVDLRYSRPLGVELDPLADPLVTKNIKRLDIAIFAWFECIDEAPRELAFWSVKCALDEQHARVVFNHVIDLSEGQLLLLLEQRSDVLVELSDLGR